MDKIDKSIKLNFKPTSIKFEDRNVISETSKLFRKIIVTHSKNKFRYKKLNK